MLIFIWALRLIQHVLNHLSLPKKDGEYKRIPSLSSNDFCLDNINHFWVSLLRIKKTSLRFPLALGNILIEIYLIKKMLNGFILGQERNVYLLFLHALKLVIHISIQLNIFYLLGFELSIIYVFINLVQFGFYWFKIFNETFAVWFHYEVNEDFCIVWLY